MNVNNNYNNDPMDTYTPQKYKNGNQDNNNNNNRKVN